MRRRERQPERLIASKRVEVRPGQTAVAPRVDDPHGFAARNDSDVPLIVSFSYDPATHVMTVAIGARSPAARLPRDIETWGKDAAGPDSLPS